MKQKKELLVVFFNGKYAQIVTFLSRISAETFLENFSNNRGCYNQTFELSHEYLAAERDYYSEAIGPAKDEVYINRRLELQVLSLGDQ